MADDNGFPPFNKANPGWVVVSNPWGLDPKKPVQIAAPGGLRISNTGGQPIPVAVQRALPFLQAKNFITQDMSKYLMQPGRLYDILDWGAAGVGSSNYTFFSRSFGQAVGGKERTNMPQANNIGQNNAFIITRIGVQFLSGLKPFLANASDATLNTANAVNDTYSVVNRGVFQLNVNGVAQFFNGIAPLTALPAPQNGVVHGGIATGNAFADIAASYTVEGDYFSFLETPITLIGGASFDATIQFPAGAITIPSLNATSQLAVYLDGYSMRPAG